MTAEPSTTTSPPRAWREPSGTAALLVSPRGEYLLHLRDANKPIWRPGTWAMPGGGREPGETLEENVRRELREEAGLNIPDLRPFAVVDDDGDDTDGAVMVYTGTWDGDPARLTVTEGIMLRWTAPEQIPVLTMEPGTAAVVARHRADPRPRPDAQGRPEVLHLRAPKARHTEPVDVHLILRRQGPAGPEVLVTRRAGAVYASGLWHLPSGHLDGAHEDVVTSLVREAREETGVVIDPADVRAAVTVHHRAPDGNARVGFFAEVLRWDGEPRIAEPALCDAMQWARLDALPEPMVAYCRAGLDTYAAGAPAAVHFQLPGDPVAYQPGADRLRIAAPAAGVTPAPAPSGNVVEFTQRTIGAVAAWEDVSWAREASRVWRAAGVRGGVWYVKTHQNARFHQREVTALRTWARELGAAAPRLVAADQNLLTVVVTALPGRPLHGAVLTPRQQRVLFHGIGALAAAIHRSGPPQPAPSGPTVDKLNRHLAAARPHLQPGDEHFVRALARSAERLPALDQVPTHGDFQLRNILLTGMPHTLPDGAEDDVLPQLAVIDYERAEPGPAVRDLVRLSDEWDGRPDLRDAFTAGYGRQLTPLEDAHLVIATARDAVSGIAYGTGHRDPELVERGRRALSRLRRDHDRAPSATGGAR